MWHATFGSPAGAQDRTPPRSDRKDRPGQYRALLIDNKHEWDCGYPGVEVLADGTFVATTYGHSEEGKEPYIVSVRFRLAELESSR